MRAPRSTLALALASTLLLPAAADAGRRRPPQNPAPEAIGRLTWASPQSNPIAVSPDGTRVAYTLDFGYLDVEEDIVRNTMAMIDQLRELGAEVVEVRPDFPAGIERAYYGHMDPLFCAALMEKAEQYGDLMCDYNLKMVAESAERTQDRGAFYEAALIESQMHERFAQLMQDFDVLVCPTALTNRLAADFNPADEDYIVAGKVQDFDLGITTCHIFNMLGRCPAISVPSGIGDNGVPTGLQIVAKAYDDERVFVVAGALERAGAAAGCAEFPPLDG